MKALIWQPANSPISEPHKRKKTLSEETTGFLSRFSGTNDKLDVSQASIPRFERANPGDSFGSQQPEPRLNQMKECETKCMISRPDPTNAASKFAWQVQGWNYTKLRCNAH